MLLQDLLLRLEPRTTLLELYQKEHQFLVALEFNYS